MSRYIIRHERYGDVQIEAHNAVEALHRASQMFPGNKITVRASRDGQLATYLYSPTRDSALTVAMTALADERVRRRQQWDRLGALLGDASYLDGGDLEAVLREAADIEYELTGDCAAVGPALDAIGIEPIDE